MATALDAAQTSDRPVLIACRTTIGYGLPTRAGTNKAHSDPPGAEEIAGARKNLNWPYEPFIVPDDISLASTYRRLVRKIQLRRRACRRHSRGALQGTGDLQEKARHRQARDSDTQILASRP